MWRREGVPLEEEADAVAAKGAAVLQQESLMDALFGVGGFTVHLGVEAFDQQAVGLFFGNDFAVLRDEVQAGFVVARFDLCEFFA